MNKHEFYKELMKDYTFESAKIRRFAKRSSLRRHVMPTRRWWHIPSTVAVAAAAVTIGVFAFLYGGGGSSPIVTVSVQERVIRSELTQSGNENATMYLSFNDSLSYNNIKDALDSVSDTDIEIKAVYILEDDNTVTAYAIPEQLEEIKRVDSARIIGAKVNAPGEYKKNLSQQQNVAFVEVESDAINDSTFVPLAAIEGAIDEVVTYFHDLRQQPEETSADFCSCCGGECKKVSCEECGVYPCECEELDCDCGECEECSDDVPCDCGECEECSDDVRCDCGECEECSDDEPCDCGECEECLEEEVE